MRYVIFLALAFFTAQQAVAEKAVVNPTEGLSVLENSFMSNANRSDAEDLALASVSFLRGIEKTLQTRYLTNTGVGSNVMDLPILRLPFAPNPNPDPFDPNVIAALFTELNHDMERVRASLSDTAFESDDIVEIDLRDLWFDVNDNGKRDWREDVMDVAGALLFNAQTTAGSFPQSWPSVIHFDAADAEWLLAYTHLLSSFSEIVLAFDPTEVLVEVASAAANMEVIKGPLASNRFSFLRGEHEFIDTFAIVYGAINRVPDRKHIATAHAHLLEMISRNRHFWQLVTEETDNSFEWIPNRNQTAALGFVLPDETQERWLAVLSDAEAVLNGDMLIGHWRTEPGGGINVAKMILDPPAVDIVTWIQGYGLLPYMEKGPLVSGENYGRFMRMFQGDALLFMVLLN